MGNYSDVKAGCASRKRYADGGRVSKTQKGSRVTVNVISSPPVAGGMPAPPVPPMGNSPSPGGAPVPPQLAQAMLGKPQPSGFARGGRVTAGAESGPGRLEKVRIQRKDGGRVLTTKARKALPKSDFGQPGERKYPMPDKSHAANAKARASQAVNAGRMSKSTEAKIDAKADRKLGKK